MVQMNLDALVAVSVHEDLEGSVSDFIGTPRTFVGPNLRHAAAVAAATIIGFFVIVSP